MVLCLPAVHFVSKESMQVARSIRAVAPRLGRAFANVSVEAPAGSFLPEELVSARVINVLRQIKACPEKVTLEQSFASDLHFDSMLRRELNNKLSDEFCIPLTSAETEKFVNGASVVKFFTKHPKAR
jgi:acyl carrier protein